MVCPPQGGCASTVTTAKDFLGRDQRQVVSWKRHRVKSQVNQQQMHGRNFLLCCVSASAPSSTAKAAASEPRSHSRRRVRRKQATRERKQCWATHRGLLLPLFCHQLKAESRWRFCTASRPEGAFALSGPTPYVSCLLLGLSCLRGRLHLCDRAPSGGHLPCARTRHYFDPPTLAEPPRQ